MKKFRILISVICIISMLVPFMTVASAEDPETSPSSWDSSFDGRYYCTDADDQGSNDDCIVYALTSAAEAYCVKYNGESENKLSFNESTICKNIPDYKNFGKAIYESAENSLGKGYYVTSVENLTSRGDICLKNKIIENGAVIAAIALPEGGMKDENCYNGENSSYYCDGKKLSSDKNHAFAIVGWDDSFGSDKFNSQSNPHKNGAWLCKNSYGTDWGDDGYFWLSYRYDFIYTACIEVSKLSGVAGTKDGISSFDLGFIPAAGFYYSSNEENAEVTVSKDSSLIYSGKMNITDGYNFVALDNPVWYGDIDISVNGKSVSPNSVLRYISPFKKKAAASEPVPEENRLRPVESVTINTEDVKNPSATTGSISHSIYCGYTDNTWYIKPADGYYFDDNTIIDLSAAKYGSSDSIRENRELGESDYAVLSDGIISIKNLEIGSAYVNGISIETDEKGEISSVWLLFDYGSSLQLKENQYTAVKSNETDTDYTVKITVNNFSADTDDFSVYVDGRLTGSESPVSADGTDTKGFSVSTHIDIPEITDFIEDFLVALARILTIFRSF